MKLTNNLKNNQNYIFGIKEYDKAFNFIVIKEKESDFHLWALMLPFIISTPWFIVYILSSNLLLFPLLLVWLFLYFKLYKYVMMMILKNRYFIYKKNPNIFTELKKDYWMKGHYKAEEFRKNLTQIHFILIKK